MHFERQRHNFAELLDIAWQNHVQRIMQSLENLTDSGWQRRCALSSSSGPSRSEFLIEREFLLSALARQNRFNRVGQNSTQIVGVRFPCKSTQPDLYSLSHRFGEVPTRALKVRLKAA
jgi:hypothetical protein